MPKQSSPYHAEVRRVSVVENRIQCEVCPKTFKRMKHLRRHARGEDDGKHRNYNLVLNCTHCKLCDRTFTKSGALAQHYNRSRCGKGDVPTTLQSDLDPEGQRSKEGNRNMSTNVSQQPLPSALPTIPAYLVTSSNLETTGHSTKWSHGGLDVTAPLSWPQEEWYNGAGPSWSQKEWTMSQEEWHMLQEEWYNGGGPSWSQKEWTMSQEEWEMLQEEWYKGAGPFWSQKEWERMAYPAVDSAEKTDGPGTTLLC